MSKLKLPLLLMATMWLVFIINFVVPLKLGVHPREISMSSAIGLLTNPFFHANLNHLVGNSMPLAILSFIFALRFSSNRSAWTMTFLLILCGSTGVWLLGSYTNHIGASGLIFAYFGYLTGGIFTKSHWLAKLRDLVLAGVVMVLYGYMVMNLFTIEAGISWAAHAWGFVAGIVLSRFHYQIDRTNTNTLSNNV